MLFDILAGDNIRDIIINFLLTLPVILIALSFHEAAHAYVAYKMGDRTAYNLGRVTLNPAKHLDLMGSIWMLAFGYGWAKPVPINARNFRDPKRGMAFTAIAGPMMNLFLGIIGTILWSASAFYITVNITEIIQNELLYRIIIALWQFFYYFAMLNFILMVYNLIPFPPFDGSRFFGLLLPEKVYWGVMKYERYTLIAIIAISFLCSRFLNFSPFYWVATKIFNFISEPILMLLEKIAFG